MQLDTKALALAVRDVQARTKIKLGAAVDTVLNRYPTMAAVDKDKLRVILKKELRSVRKSRHQARTPLAGGRLGRGTYSPRDLASMAEREDKNDALAAYMASSD